MMRAAPDHETTLYMPRSTHPASMVNPFSSANDLPSQGTSMSMPPSSLVGAAYSSSSSSSRATRSRDEVVSMAIQDAMSTSGLFGDSLRPFMDNECGHRDRARERQQRRRAKLKHLDILRGSRLPDGTAIRKRRKVSSSDGGGGDGKGSDDGLDGMGNMAVDPTGTDPPPTSTSTSATAAAALGRFPVTAGPLPEREDDNNRWFQPLYWPTIFHCLLHTRCDVQETVRMLKRASQPKYGSLRAETVRQWLMYDPGADHHRWGIRMDILEVAEQYRRKMAVLVQQQQQQQQQQEGKWPLPGWNGGTPVGMTLVEPDWTTLTHSCASQQQQQQQQYEQQQHRDPYASQTGDRYPQNPYGGPNAFDVTVPGSELPCTQGSLPSTSTQHTLDATPNTQPFSITPTSVSVAPTSMGAPLDVPGVVNVSLAAMDNHRRHLQHVRADDDNDEDDDEDDLMAVLPSAVAIPRMPSHAATAPDLPTSTILPQSTILAQSTTHLPHATTSLSQTLDPLDGLSHEEVDGLLESFLDSNALHLEDGQTPLFTITQPPTHIFMKELDAQDGQGSSFNLETLLVSPASFDDDHHHHGDHHHHHLGKTRRGRRRRMMLVMRDRIWELEMQLYQTTVSLYQHIMNQQHATVAADVTAIPALGDDNLLGDGRRDDGVHHDQN